MRYIFIINPYAGKGSTAQKLTEEIHAVFAANPEHSFDIHETTAPQDATAFVRHYPATGEPLCFVACGGDGTISEVAAGLVPRQDASLAVYPCGSGNDFVKVFGGYAGFRDIAALLRGKQRQIDLLRCGDSYSVNLCNLGLDARVAELMQRFKRLPLVSGTMAYTLALLVCVFGRLGEEMQLEFDDGETVNGRFLLAAAANGICYGGSYYAAPLARVDDGLIDFCAVRKVSRFVIASLIGAYQRGQHLNDPRFEPHLVVRRCRTVTIRGKKPFTVSLDGEISRTDSLSVSVMPAALTLHLPSTADVAMYSPQLQNR